MRLPPLPAIGLNAFLDHKSNFRLRFFFCLQQKLDGIKNYLELLVVFLLQLPISSPPGPTRRPGPFGFFHTTEIVDDGKQESAEQSSELLACRIG
jgi:hypothetical protein